MLVANNVPNFERNDLDIHFFRYSGGSFGARHLGDASTQRLPPERHSYPEGIATRRNEAFGERGNLEHRPLEGCEASGDAARSRTIRPQPPPKSKLACKLAYDLRLPPYAACLRLP